MRIGAIVGRRRRRTATHAHPYTVQASRACCQVACLYHATHHTIHLILRDELIHPRGGVAPCYHDWFWIASNGSWINNSRWFSANFYQRGLVKLYHWREQVPLSQTLRMQTNGSTVQYFWSMWNLTTEDFITLMRISWHENPQQNILSCNQTNLVSLMNLQNWKIGYENQLTYESINGSCTSSQSTKWHS